MPTRVRRLRIASYRQFADIDLDFTAPGGGAVSRVCFVGRNGTGKSTILDLLGQSVTRLGATLDLGDGCAVELEADGRRYLKISRRFITGTARRTERAVVELEGADRGDPLWGCRTVEEWKAAIAGYSRPVGVLPDLVPRRDLVVHVLPEAAHNTGLELGAGAVPQTTLNEALELFREFPVHHQVSTQLVPSMWRLLVYLVKKRDSDRESYENRPENLQKTKARLIEEFDRLYPSVLHGLAVLWNRILMPADLVFDVAAASIPVQLTENLRAYVKVASTGEQVPYGQLSTGMRNFLFRIGHLYLLYHAVDVERGFVLVDEPENSLFPDFLFEVMQTYEDIVRDPSGEARTQMFFATHNPIVAAQFEPHERVVLRWEGRHVTAGRGTAPKGDDPNDLLSKDFELPHLMGPSGREQWERYVDLRRQLRAAEGSERDALLASAAEIGRLYGFGRGP